MDYFVYMLRCQDGSLYTGIATDWHRRLEEHMLGKGAKYTKSHPVLRVERVWQASDKIAACKLEYHIKTLSKLQKERLITREAAISDLLSETVDPNQYEVVI